MPDLIPNAAITLKALAERYHLTLVGHGEQVVTRMTHLALAQSDTDLVYAPNPQALIALLNSPARCALTGSEVDIPQALLDNRDFALLVAPRDKLALAYLLQHFEQPAFIEPGIHASAVIHPSTVLGANVTVGPLVAIGPHVVIGAGSVLHSHVSVGAGAELGENCLLHAGVRIGDRVRLGNRVICQPNAVIGPDGFSYVTEQDSKHESLSGKGSATVQPQVRMPSVGTVVLEDDVEVGANTCIDRATLAETRIGRGTKIDNLVQIGHNNTVGEHCLIVSQVGLAGSCKVGDGVVLAGQAGFADHLTIGDRAIVMAKSGVIRNVEPDTIVGGSPAMPRRQILETLLYTARLKEMNQSIKALTKQVAALELAAQQTTGPAELS